MITQSCNAAAEHSRISPLERTFQYNQPLESIGIHWLPAEHYTWEVSIYLYRGYFERRPLQSNTFLPGDKSHDSQVLFIFKAFISSEMAISQFEASLYFIAS